VENVGGRSYRDVKGDVDVDDEKKEKERKKRPLPLHAVTAKHPLQQNFAFYPHDLEEVHSLNLCTRPLKPQRSTVEDNGQKRNEGGTNGAWLVKAACDDDDVQRRRDDRR